MKKFVEDNLTPAIMEVGQWGFHGDVIVIRVDEEPENKTPVEDKCLAYGEATGHIHKLFSDDDVEVVEAPETKERYYKVDDVIYLKHQEHNPVAFLTPGIYKSRIGREYDHIEQRMREIAD